MQIRNILFILVLIISSDSISAQCFVDRHNANSDNSWLSCSPSTNPNSERPSPAHWIMYELDDIKEVHDMDIWNYNNVNESSNGINEFSVDVSIDGQNWTDVGTFNMPESTGSAFYEGLFVGRLEGRSANYILITALSNHGGSCYGFSELRINLEATQDLSPSVRILPSIASGPTEMLFSIQLLEIEGKETSGLITVVLPKDDQLSFDWDGGLTSFSSFDFNNPDWTYDGSNASFHIWTTENGIAASGQSSIGLITTYDPQSTNGNVTYTASIIQGSGNETNDQNNIDAETIVFFSNQ